MLWLGVSEQTVMSDWLSLLFLVLETLVKEEFGSLNRRLASDALTEHCLQGCCNALVAGEVNRQDALTP